MNDSLDETTTVIRPDPIGYVELAVDRTGWHDRLIIASDISASLGLRELLEEEEQQARENGLAPIWVEGSEEGRSNLVPLEAVRSGWHRVRAVPAARRDRGGLVITWEGETLRRPCDGGGGPAEGYVWLDRTDDERMAWARELARYFILGYTKGSWIDRELDERPNQDPYPDLSALGLEHESLLWSLAYEPGRLDDDDRHDARDVGRRVRELLNLEQSSNGDANGG